MKKLGENIIEFVYILSDGFDRYKIGSTKQHPEKRLKQLQTGNPSKLKIAHSIPCSLYPARYLEKRLLNKWFWRDRLTGEWRSLNSEDINWVKSITSDRQVW